MGTMVDPIRRGSFDNKDESAAHAAHAAATVAGATKTNSTSNSFAFLKDDYSKEEIDKIFLEDIFLQGNPELHFQPYEQRRFQGFSTMHNRARNFQHQPQAHSQLPGQMQPHANSNATTTANLNISLNLNLSSNNNEPQSMQAQVVRNTVPSSSTFKPMKRSSSGSSNSRKSKTVKKNNSAPMKYPNKVSNNKANKSNKSTSKAKGKSAMAKTKTENINGSTSSNQFQSIDTTGRNQQLLNGASSHQTSVKQELNHRQMQMQRQQQQQQQQNQSSHQIDFDFAGNHLNHFGGGDGDMLTSGFPHYDNHSNSMHNSVKIAGDHLLPYQGMYRQQHQHQQQNHHLQQQLPVHSLASIEKIYNPKKKKKKNNHDNDNSNGNDNGKVQQQAPDTSKLHKPKIDLEAQSSIFKKRREKWSEDEMKTLWEAIITYGNNWTAVSKKVVTRNYFQIKDKGRRELCVRGWETGRKKTEGKEAMRQAQLIAKQELLKMTQ